MAERRKRLRKVITDEEEEQKEADKEESSSSSSSSSSASESHAKRDEDSSSSTTTSSSEHQPEPVSADDEPSVEPQRQQQRRPSNAALRQRRRPRRQQGPPPAALNVMPTTLLELVARPGVTATPEQLGQQVANYAAIRSVLEIFGYDGMPVVMTPQGLAMLSVAAVMIIDRIILEVLFRHHLIEAHGDFVHKHTGVVLTSGERAFHEGLVMPKGQPLVHTTSVSAVLNVDPALRLYFADLTLMHTNRPAPAVSFPRPRKSDPRKKSKAVAAAPAAAELPVPVQQ